MQGLMAEVEHKWLITTLLVDEFDCHIVQLIRQIFTFGDFTSCAVVQ